MRQWLKNNKWPVATIAGLLALNAVLIGVLVLRPSPVIPAVPAGTSTSSPSDDPTDSGTDAESEPSDDSSSSSSESPATEESESSESTVPNTRMLTLASPTKAWRATVGDCDEAGTIELSTDSGGSWEPVTDPELSPVSRIRSTGTNTLFAVGGNEDSCNATYAISYSSGAAWETRPESLRGAWYITPKLRSEVRASTGDRSKPCGGDVVDLAAPDSRNAAALCTDGTLRVSQDAGESWDETETLGNAVALGADAEGYVVAGLGERCEGVTVITFPTGDPADAGEEGCAPIKDAEAGAVAVAKRGSTVWVWAGDAVAVSSDSGSTWG